MEKLDKAIDWSRVGAILTNHYTVGTSGEGADAYPPLLLFKCMLLQKWFHIDSDPELENQINDRWSFKKFLHLPLSKPSPDHSTFSRPAPLDIGNLNLSIEQIGTQNYKEQFTSDLALYI